MIKDEVIIYNNKNKGKINLNSELDLYKIPISVLKSTKLSDFNGKLIQQLLTEMMNDSENININNIRYPYDNNYVNSPKLKSKSIKINNTNYSKSKERLKQKNGINSLYLYDNEIKKNKSAYYSNKTIKRINYINDKSQIKIEKINFQIKYDTRMGEDLAVIGSINELGNWEPYRALKMNWNDGNIWKTVLYLRDMDILDFEYKFIVTCGGYVKRWEDGNNRKMNLDQIKGLIEACPGEGTIIHLKNIEGKNIDFNYNDNTLNIVCWWNIK